MSNPELVQYTTDGDVVILHLNQPETLNAINDPVGEALTEGLKRASGEARAVVLSSRGRAFSSGASLAGGMIDVTDTERDVGAHLDTLFNPIIRLMRDYPIPLVTAVRGPAAGVGCSIALMGDLIVAGKSAYFLQAFANIGLIPDGGSPYLLARSIGRVRAMEMMLLGERLPANEAFQMGLINRLVDDEKVEETAIEIAQKLAAGPTKALALIRKSAWAALDSTLDEQLDLERQLQRDAGRTKGFLEGVTAFAQKKKPEFSGE